MKALPNSINERRCALLDARSPEPEPQMQDEEKRTFRKTRLRNGDARPFLSLSHATFRLGDRLVFADTSWTFHRNQHWAVVGENGSGKSWFADALRGLLPLVQGEFRYHFRAASGWQPEEMIGHVGFEDRRSDLQGTVVQSRWNSLEEEGALCVREFLSYDRVMDVNPYEVRPVRDLGRDRFAGRQRKAIELLGLQPFLERVLLTLSNGERQRVQWARALCHPLRLLILDEPFIGLDHGARRDFHRLLERLARTPLRILFITALADELPPIITNVLRVKSLRVIAAGPTKPTRRSQTKRGIPPQPRTLDEEQRLPSQGALVRSGTPTRTGKHESPLVVFRDVTVRYGTRTILDQINWTVEPGESWALLGPNGAGKSTLLSLILGDNPQAYSNEIMVFGLPRGHGESIWQIKRHIGWVSPELQVHFNDRVTCFDVVGSGFRDTIGLFEPLHSQQRSKVRAWLEQIGLAAQAENPLAALSLGEQRMVLLARALVKSPRLLILDEPCQGLDPSHRTFFLRKLDGLLRTHSVTAIYVTHRPEEIPRSIRRVLRLADGRPSLHFRRSV
jgi:molybdate transport system ATP-binding protein